MERLTCLRCGHTWYARTPELPIVCAACKSYKWRTPKKIVQQEAQEAV